MIHWVFCRHHKQPCIVPIAVAGYQFSCKTKILQNCRPFIVGKSASGMYACGCFVPIPISPIHLPPGGETHVPKKDEMSLNIWIYFQENESDWSWLSEHIL